MSGAERMGKKQERIGILGLIARILGLKGPKAKKAATKNAREDNPKTQANGGKAAKNGVKKKMGGTRKAKAERIAGKEAAKGGSAAKKKVPWINAGAGKQIKPAEKPEAGLAKESARSIAREKIRTDFDKVLEFASRKNGVTKAQIAGALGLKLARVQECCEVLEKSGLVKIHYSTFGPEIVIPLGASAAKGKGD